MKISDQQFRELLTRYLEGTATPAERAMLDDFFASYGSGSHESGHPSDERRDKMLRKIHSRVVVKKKKKGKTRLISLWLPLAAAICIFAMAYFFIDRTEFSSAETVQQVVMMKDSTASGQRVAKLLPDGTEVHLNSNTSISYPQRFGAIREVTVNGEAFFDVTRNGKQFIVHSGDVTTEVLGTSFNVRHRAGEDTQVTLVEGKVNVRSTSGDSLTLSPDEQAVMAPNTWQFMKRHVDAKRYAYWKDDILFFDHTPLAVAIGEIEDWYAVKIDVRNEDLLRCELTGKYQNEPLGNVLSSLQFLFKLDIRGIGKDHYRINGKGCK